MYALFVYLKAAFDMMDRMKLWEMLRKKNINERRMEWNFERYMGKKSVKLNVRNTKTKKSE